jgi:hypothetical protein
MTSKLVVDNIQGKATASKVDIAGHVVQVIYAETDTRQSLTSTSYVDLTGMTATITPFSTSNKILVQVCLNLGHEPVGMNISCQLLRGSTNIFAGTDTSMKQGFIQTECNLGANFQYEIKNFTATTLDAPATDSAVVYKVQSKVNTAAGTWYMNRNHNNSSSQGTTKSSITLLEIGV